jgi:hypothetical protein
MKVHEFCYLKWAFNDAFPNFLTLQAHTSDMFVSERNNTTFADDYFRINYLNYEKMARILCGIQKQQKIIAIWVQNSSRCAIKLNVTQICLIRVFRAFSTNIQFEKLQAI